MGTPSLLIFAYREDYLQYNMVERYPKQNYRFPHVRFNERTVGPEPVRKDYRNKIGLVAPFNHGPELANITTREGLKAFFGDDGSTGSEAFNQAMLQGANDFVVSRVLPTGQASTASITLSGYDGVKEPIVGENPTSEPGRTIGLKLEFGYRGFPRHVEGTPEIGATVRTQDDDTRVLWDSNNSKFIYVGSSALRYQVKETLRMDDYWDSSNSQAQYYDERVSITTNTDMNVLSLTDGQLYLIKLDKSSLDSNNTASAINTLVSKGKPGVYIRKDGDSSDLFKIQSYLWTEDGYIKFFAFAQQTVTLDPDTNGSFDIYLTTQGDVDPADDENYYILGVRLDEIEYPGDTSTIDSSIWTDKIEDFYNFMLVKQGDNSWHKTHLIQHDTGDQYQLFDTNVDVQFGAESYDDVGYLVEEDTTTLDTEFFLNEGAEFVSLLLSNYVTLGEPTDDNGSSEDAFPAGKTGSEILKELEDAILEDPSLNEVLGEVSTQTLFSPYNINFTASKKGVPSNRLVFELNRFVSDSTNSSEIDDVQFLDDGSSQYGMRLPFQGGRSSMKRAQRVLYDQAGNSLVLVQAVTAGRFGNDISVTAVPLARGNFRLNVEVDSNGTQVNSESLSLNNRNVEDNGLYTASRDSQLVRVFFVPIIKYGAGNIPEAVYDLLPQRAAPPSILVSDTSSPKHIDSAGPEAVEGLSLRGGYEPENYAEGKLDVADFEDAVTRLEDQDVDIIALVGFHLGEDYYFPAVNAALTQAENSSPFNGLRTVVAAAPPNLSKRTAERIGSIYDSSRMVIVGGWVTFTGSANQGRNSSSPVGIYAGKVAATEPHVSPSGAGPVSGVLSSSIRPRPDFLDTLTRLGIDAVYYDNATNSFKLLNGRTTSSDSIGKWASIRKISDHVISNLYVNLTWARSEPNTPETRARAASAADAFLETLVEKGRILSFVPSVADESNNTPQDVRSGVLNIKITYTPIFPADIISVGVTRSVTEVISVS